MTSCAGNSDTDCFCPNAAFVQNVYDCVYAYAPNDQAVADAVGYFQGLCGNYAQRNPVIVTGAGCIGYINATYVPPPAAQPTVIWVTATTVVPCPDKTGGMISSAVVQTLSAQVPQIGLHSVGNGIGIVPITYTSPPNPAETGKGKGSSPYVMPSSNGTTGATKTGSSEIPYVTAGASRAQVGAGFGAAALAAFALAL